MLRDRISRHEYDVARYAYSVVSKCGGFHLPDSEPVLGFTQSYRYLSPLPHVELPVTVEVDIPHATIVQ